MEEKKYAEGHFKSKWMLFGVGVCSAITIPIGLIYELYFLVGVGPLAGAIIGKLIGEHFENKHKAAGNLRPLNEKEIRNIKIQVAITFLIGIIGFIFLAMTL